MLIYICFAAVAVLASSLALLSLHCFGVADIDVLNKINIKSGCARKKEEHPEITDKPNTETENVEETDNEVEKEDTDTVSAEPEKSDEKSCVYSKGFCIVLFFVSIVAMFGICAALNRYVFAGEITAEGCFNFTKLFSVFVITLVCAFIDFKLKIIPNKIVLAGLLIRSAVYIGELIWCRDVIKDIVINDLIGFALGFGLLFIVGLISRGALGFGDIKLFAVIGLSVGSLATFGTLLFSLFASSVAGIGLMIKYKDRKRAFPWAPFIFIGYTAVLLMGNF